jgi:hypothetical protein
MEQQYYNQNLKVIRNGEFYAVEYAVRKEGVYSHESVLFTKSDEAVNFLKTITINK